MATVQWGQLRPVKWGEMLETTIRRAKVGGMPAISEVARAVTGPMIGSRTTFTDLYKLDEPPTDQTAGFRAWIALAVAGEDPGAWGVVDDVVPLASRPTRTLKKLLRAQAERDRDEAGRESR